MQSFLSVYGFFVGYILGLPRRSQVVNTRVPRRFYYLFQRASSKDSVLSDRPFILPFLPLPPLFARCLLIGAECTLKRFLSVRSHRSPVSCLRRVACAS
ncbi:hypothetical protein F5141DRAFT_1153138 [Pisolithus sp. B1]|nr:hypothetical protein F5141DRAFT_1153138 [Pisolithus sp. B1]